MTFDPTQTKLYIQDVTRATACTPSATSMGSTM